MKNHKRKALSFLLIISLFIGMVGIVNVDTTYAASKKIHLKKTKITMLTGKTYQQKLIDKKGKTIKATKVKWKSLKTSVAKINKKGKITALKAGTAKMTAKYKGKTYKFTVKVKAHNKTISVEPSSATMEVGETKTFIVKTDAGEAIYFDQDNNNVECEWGDWIDGTNDSYFYVTGVKLGSSVITIYDDADKSVKATINVTVDYTYDSAMQYLYNYIDENGIENSNGRKELDFTIDSENSVSVINLDDSIRFSYISKNTVATTSATGMPSMILPLSGKPDTVTADVTIFVGKLSFAMMTADVDMANYSFNTPNLTFEKTSGDITNDANLQKLTNSYFASAVINWQLMLMKICPFTLKTLGFTSLP